MRRNSVFYRNERKYLTAKTLGVSPITFGKYIRKLQVLGLIIESNGNLIFVKLSTCIKILLDKDGKDFKAFRYAKIPKSGKFKEIYQQIQVEIFKLNINQQQYHNNRLATAKELLSKNRIKEGDLSLIKKVKKQNGFTNFSQISSIDERSLKAKTGKYHLASKLGCSPSTGLNRLRKWNLKGIIKRSVITKQLLPANEGSFDYLKCQYKYLFINKHTGCFYANIGSVVSFIG